MFTRKAEPKIEYHRTYVEEEMSEELRGRRKKQVLHVLPIWISAFVFIIWMVQSRIVENDRVTFLVMGILLVIASIPATVLVGKMMTDEKRLYEQGRRFHGTILKWERAGRQGTFPVYEFYTEEGWHKVRASSGGSTFPWNRKKFEEKHQCVWYDPTLVNGIRIQTKREWRLQYGIMKFMGILLWIVSIGTLAGGAYYALWGYAR